MEPYVQHNTSKCGSRVQTTTIYQHCITISYRSCFPLFKELKIEPCTIQTRPIHQVQFCDIRANLTQLPDLRSRRTVQFHIKTLQQS